jgi:drug/metabolite transporter (DMT)-like permease
VESRPVKAAPANDLWIKIGLILLSGLLYGVTIASVDVAADHIPPFTLTALRLITATAVYAVVFSFRRPSVTITRRMLPDILVIGLLNIGLPFLSLALAVKFISSSMASVLFNIQPVFTVLIAHWMLSDEKLNLPKIIGMLSAVAGASLLMIMQESGLSAGGELGWVGKLIIIFASLSNGFGLVVAKIRLKGIEASVLASSQVLASLVVIGPLALIVEGAPQLNTFGIQGWVAMILAAVCAPVAAYWLMFYMMNRYSASLAGFSGIATPLFSVLIGLLFLGEIINGPILFGAVLLLVGVWFLHYF